MLTIDSRIQKLITKEIELPAYLDGFNAIDGHWYPHPPCLVPLFLGHGASYKGIVKHFFCDRKETYAEYILEHGHLSEIARDTDQFITSIVLQMIMTKDGLTHDIVRFCEQVDYKYALEVDEFTVEYGDDPKEFGHLPYFDQNMPFKYLRTLSEYNGDFPSSIYTLNSPDIIQNSSLYEIADEGMLSTIMDLPTWLLSTGDKNAQFYDYLNRGQFKEAWFTLNSKGWELKDLAVALNELKKKSVNRELEQLADDWISKWQNSSS
ncbi:hypothetical protein ABDD95_23020 [Mucilaginibacter sp. PAMB04274]|uniref:hypothetical protein n=1 Tax=Mucilaginibacter sp. PAMB04274 TaxID=3138568 RepID=UPI0031F66C8F